MRVSYVLCVSCVLCVLRNGYLILGALPNAIQIPMRSCVLLR